MRSTWKKRQLWCRWRSPPHSPCQRVRRSRPSHPLCRRVLRRRPPHPLCKRVQRFRPPHPPYGWVRRSRPPHPLFKRVQGCRPPHPPCGWVRRRRPPHPSHRRVPRRRPPYPFRRRVPGMDLPCPQRARVRVRRRFGPLSRGGGSREGTSRLGGCSRGRLRPNRRGLASRGRMCPRSRPGPRCRRAFRRSWLPSLPRSGPPGEVRSVGPSRSPRKMSGKQYTPRAQLNVYITTEFALQCNFVWPESMAPASLMVMAL